MRWLVTGAGGMLGQDLVATLRSRGHLVTAARRTDLDLTDPGAVTTAVAGHDLVVNAAAWTDVDAAETAEEQATAVNGHAVATLAGVCRTAGTHLLQISTDYVLGGSGPEPLNEYAPAAPVNAYGRGKLVGERAVARLLPHTGLIVRTAWLYGCHGRNFVSTMLRLAADRPGVCVVADQVGQPTSTAALAGQLVALGVAARAGKAAAGVYHGTARGRTSWYGLARAVYAAAGLDPGRVTPVSSTRFPRPARRPAFGVLGHGRWATAGLPEQPPWHDQLLATMRTAHFAGLAAAARAAS
jgi:dTDP-4-dehydrorhamnose reductase